MREDDAELRLVRRACSRLHLDQIRPHSLNFERVSIAACQRRRLVSRPRCRVYRRCTGHTIDGAENGGRRRAAGKVNAGVISMEEVRDQGRPGIVTTVTVCSARLTTTPSRRHALHHWVQVRFSPFPRKTG
jgi:hypothetical protein